MEPACCLAASGLVGHCSCPFVHSSIETLADQQTQNCASRSRSASRLKRQQANDCDETTRTFIAGTRKRGTPEVSTLEPRADPVDSSIEKGLACYEMPRSSRELPALHAGWAPRVQPSCIDMPGSNWATNLNKTTSKTSISLCALRSSQRSSAIISSSLGVAPGHSRRLCCKHNGNPKVRRPWLGGDVSPSSRRPWLLSQDLGLRSHGRQGGA